MAIVVLVKASEIGKLEMQFRLYKVISRQVCDVKECRWEEAMRSENTVVDVAVI
jgi:hypothetical protein